MRFAGSTMDFSALYRLESVLNLYAEIQLTVDHIHHYIQKLQKAFLQQLEEIGHPELNSNNLLMTNPAHHGHFLTFRLSCADKVQTLHRVLKQRGIITDARGDRLRFGFALYQNPEEFDLSALEQVDE